MLGKSISINSLILGAFAVFTATILASTEYVTREKIAIAERKAAQKALSEIIPQDMHDNDLLTDILQLDENYLERLNLEDNAALHIARKNGNLTAIIVPSVAPDGYSGSIKFIVGIDINGQVKGVRVLAHKETPGLGDKIDLNKDDWILSFAGKSLSNPMIDKWKVKKDGGEFDQFTGATITPRAVVAQVKETLTLFTPIKMQQLLQTQTDQQPNPK